MSLLGFGARSLVPDELLEGYGYDAATATWLIRPATPLYGLVHRPSAYPSPAIVQVQLFPILFPLQVRRSLIWQAAYDAVTAGIGRAGGSAFGLEKPNPEFRFLWRAQGSADAWKEVPGGFLGVTLATSDSTVTEGTRLVGQMLIEDGRRDPLGENYDAGAPDLPAQDETIEFYLIGPIAPDELHPIVVEGITAGQFTQNVYDGVYSRRDPLTGAAVPTGIRYDATALALMTDLVRIRMWEPIEDVRDWLEKNIYAPTGWAPALDSDGRISPVSQVPPADTSGLDVIYDDITEPSPDWDAGSRIINILSLTYKRDYSLGPPDPPPTDDQVVRQNLVGEREIQFEYRDEDSIVRFGEETLAIDGEAFRAIGRPATDLEEETLPTTSIPVYQGMITKLMTEAQFFARLRSLGIGLPGVISGAHIIPISGDVTDETGYQLFQLRMQYLLDRYRLGAPAFRVAVMREALPLVRAGSWVAVAQLSWLPDYITQRRGLIALGQVISIGDLDCAWRRVLVEVLVPPSTS